MGQFLIQGRGSAMVITFPYASSLERGANMATAEEWLMDLPPVSFNQFANASFQAIKLVKNSVVWIPYGWAIMMVHCEREITDTLVIPYLNVKLAHAYPSIGLLVNFHVGHVKINQKKGAKFHTEHWDSYVGWLQVLNPQPQVEQDSDQGIHPEQPALMDGSVEEQDSQTRDQPEESDSSDQD